MSRPVRAGGLERAWRHAQRPLTLAACGVLVTTASVFGLRPAAARAVQAQGAEHDATLGLPYTDAEYVVGAASAPVTGTVYLSVTCVHCAAFARDTWPRAEAELIASGRVRFVIREAPTAPVAVSSAGFLLARCRGRTGYWPTVQELMRHQAHILAAGSVGEAIRIESEIAGLSDEDSRYCLSDMDLIDAANARRQAALAEGVDSTPFFLIDGAPLRPGRRLARSEYRGGELSWPQLADAVGLAGVAKASPH